MPTNTNKMTCPLESVEQQRVISWAKWQRYEDFTIDSLLFAIPNGGSRAKRGNLSLEAIRMKKEGVKAGVPDLMLALPKAPYHGLFIEMKRKLKSLSTVSAAQKEWHSKLRDRGYRVAVCYGADEAINIIKEYLYENEDE